MLLQNNDDADDVAHWLQFGMHTTYSNTFYFTVLGIGKIGNTIVASDTAKLKLNLVHVT